ncbi:MAG: DsrE family protein, partial [bacterium]
QTRIKIAIGNVINLLKDIAPARPDVEIVINGPGIEIFTKKNIVKQLEELSKKGVRIVACRNSINAYCRDHPECKISEEKLPEFVNVVSAGISELIRKQGKGYAYIKP